MPQRSKKTLTTTTNAEALRFARRIAEQVSSVLPLDLAETRTILHTVLDGVFGDQEIRQNFVGTEIRYTAMCGEVAREIMRIVGAPPEVIGLLSIGDVRLPEFVRPSIDEILESAHEFHRQLSEEETYGYDLSSRGSLKARQAMIVYFDRHYGFSGVPNLENVLAENAAICAGGMRGLDDIATAHVRLAVPNSHPRFIHPDNSFGTWHSITRLRSVDGKVATVHVLPTKPEHGLHLTEQDVQVFYDRNGCPMEWKGLPLAQMADLWYITPVGNPSGTRMGAQQLADVCQRIVSHAPEATILLDCTYVRTLPEFQARALIGGVINTPEVVNRVIFLDSFSKTHGLCGERIGAYFSANRKLFDQHHNINMLLSAGNGRHKSAVVLALAHATAAQELTIQSLHQFWQKERLGLYHYLLSDHRFPELFEPDQLHLPSDQLASPLGLYLFVKVSDGVTGKDVLMHTGCLGVETQMGSGRYIRFSVGRITKPTYSTYVPAQLTC